jgi:glutathione S-transferase
MPAKLYVILGSHACRTGMLLLEHKGIEYERVVLPTGVHPLSLRLRGFAANPEPFRLVGDRSHPTLEIADRMGTVPALLADGQRVKTNRQIARFLERVRPEPPLFPSDPDRRRAVEEAERWGDDVLQMLARRLTAAAGRRGLDALVDGGARGRLGPLLWRRPAARSLGVRLVANFFRAGARTEPELLAALPGMLDRVDDWIESGVLNGDDLYAADLVIAPSLALLAYRRDLRPEIERRPAIRLLDRVLPEPATAGS